MKHLILFFSLFSLPLISSDSEQRFTQLYREAKWGLNEKGEGFSGAGSTVREAAPYMKFLQDFIKKNKIKTILDVGCGDWTFSQHMDWNGAKYTGIDIVRSVIEKNKAKFSSSKVKFLHSDGMEIDLPKADLLICKDVLQHLPNHEIFKFLKQIGKFKHCLITNDVEADTKSSDNSEKWDLTYGRKLDLTQDPFKLKGQKAFTYTSGWDTKQVLYVKN